MLHIFHHNHRLCECERKIDESYNSGSVSSNYFSIFLQKIKHIIYDIFVFEIKNVLKVRVACLLASPNSVMIIGVQ